MDPAHHMRHTLFLTLFLTFAAHAGEGQYDGLSRGELKTLNSEAFLNAHPDMKYRLEGWVAFEEGRLEDALAHFDHASRYGDKLSKAMLAEMHWDGRGVTRDRALAYAWADLAAERGYPRLVVLRERYWEGLDEGGRARAIEAGQALYAEYGDEAAQPRMARHLRDARRGMAGKRPRRNAEVLVPDGRGGWTRIQGYHFYAARFWEPERYREWVDETWMPPPRGRVDVGDLETMRVGEPTPDPGADEHP